MASNREECECGCPRAQHVEVPGCTECPCTGYVARQASTGARPRRCYASHSIEARNMLAVWLDESPVVGKDQRDPDGWTTGVADTDFLVVRLAELANASNVDVIRMHGAAAEWWSKIESNRRRAASKERRRRDEGAVLSFPFPPDVEELGRRAALDRQAMQMKGGRKR